MELKHTVTSTLLIFSMLSTTENKAKAQTNSDNPFLTEYTSSFEVPPFDQIKNEHFMPAFEAGMEEQAKRISTIYLQRSAPTFQNTIEAMERSGDILNKVSTVFFNLNSARSEEHTSELQSRE